MPEKTEHPSIKRFRERSAGAKSSLPVVLDAQEVRETVLKAGADDVGFVEIDRAELAAERDDILRFFPHTKSLVSFVLRMNREPIHNPARSVANLEFHHSGERVNEIARHLVARLEAKGIRAINPSMGFPMEMVNVGAGKLWLVSHKTVAVVAGLGHMGIHRNVIHPKFGNFILLGTVLVDVRISEYQQPLDYNPCVECKLCVSACPVGAIASDGAFNFSACYTHNYREFLGGFTDWVGQIADSKNAKEYRQKVTDGESASMWQSLSFGANYKSAYCMGVCPAGDEVLAPFLTNRAQYLKEVVKSLQELEETVYVIPKSDAEEYVARRFPHKQIKRVGNGLNRLRSIQSFLNGLPLTFQRNQSKGLAATFHFNFTGAEERRATVKIRNQKVEVSEGQSGIADIVVSADSQIWLDFLAKERNLVWALLRRK